jgi:hypothetical protein
MVSSDELPAPRASLIAVAHWVSASAFDAPDVLAGLLDAPTTSTSTNTPTGTPATMTTSSSTRVLPAATEGSVAVTDADSVNVEAAAAAAAAELAPQRAEKANDAIIAKEPQGQGDDLDRADDEDGAERVCVGDK